MPDRSPGFTPINHPEGSSSDLESSPAQHIQKNQGVHQGSAPRRRRKNQLIKNYLSPSKSSSGVSMFERAAISHGEEPQVKKRKTRKSSGEKMTDQNAQPQEQSSDRAKTAGRRTVSEGMRITKPGVFTPLKPQDPAFNPRSAADRWIVQDDNGPQQIDASAKSLSKLNAFRVHGHPDALDDNISVVAPVTSMDIIISTPTSSTTMDSLTMHSKSSQQGTHRLQSSPQTNVPVISTTAPQCESRMSSLKDVENDGENVQLFTQTDLFNRHRALLPPQGAHLGTILEEFEPDALQEYQSRNDGFDGIKQARNIQEDHADDHDECTENADEFDIFDDGLSEGDLLHCLDETQKENRGPSSVALTAESREKQDLSQAVDSWDMEDEFFQEDWEVLEDEDDEILEQAAASMDSATILNQVSSNVQKVRVTPVTVSSTCGEPDLLRSPDLKPILRPPFPERVQDRSPIIGLSAAISLRTCFRIGEALNVGSQAVREHQTVFIELYARVRWSFREPRSVKQHFTLMDLFHDRPPYLDGTYEIWKGVELYEQDSGRFLERSAHPLLCRCVGKLKRDGISWKLTILSIWEATMDDVEHVSGIIQ